MAINSIKVLALLMVSAMVAGAQEFQLTKGGPIPSASYRGLSVVNDRVAWMSGNNGMVGRSLDGGKSWDIHSLQGFEKAEFRSLYAFDDTHAVIANAGSPGYILTTDDGGQHWTTVYSNNHPEVFFDGIDFWNDRDGLIYGDPIDGKMLMLRTSNGGKSWTPIQTAPALQKGEASFAASGTGIRCYGKKDVMICTGGLVSRLWKSEDRGDHWVSMNPPIAQGEATTGIYSFAVLNKHITIVGGDYKQARASVGNHFYSEDGGQTWKSPSPTVRGYRECVEFITGKDIISVGPSGADVSTDGGMSWRYLSEEQGIHVVRKARKGSLVIMTGNTASAMLVSKH